MMEPDKDTPTPRTDALVEKWCQNTDDHPVPPFDSIIGDEMVFANHARTLEMENAALRKALEDVRELFRKATGYTVEGYREMGEEVRNER